jgi:AraC-like DNA-binding protein
VPLRLDFAAFDHVAQLFAYRGHAEAISGRQTIDISESRSFVASPGDTFKLNYARNFDQLVLKINPAVLVSKLEALRGEHLANQLQFGPSKKRQEYNESLRRMLLFGIERLDSTDSKFHPVAVAEFEQSVVVAFLCSTQHNYSEWLDQQSTAAAPWQVRVAEEYIEANWDQPLTIEALAIVTGASARTIFHSFKRSRGYTPMGFVKNIRLRHANAMLATGATSVSDAALLCGFGNFGHFANYYRIKFGELPSQTLKRAKGA